MGSDYCELTKRLMQEEKNRGMGLTWITEDKVIREWLNVIHIGICDDLLITVHSPLGIRIAKKLGLTPAPTGKIEPLVGNYDNPYLTHQQIADKLNEVILKLNTLGGEGK